MAADVASALKSWSTTESSNSPSGSTSISTNLDENLRMLQTVVRQDLAHKGADIASATTTDLGAVAGLMHDITGTTTITGFGTVSAGIWKIIKFEGALTLTHNATSLILPGGANITTANGDIAIVISEGSGNWRCVSYFKANGQALGINISGLTADTAPDEDADYVATYDDSASANKKVLLTNLGNLIKLQTNTISAAATSGFDNLLTSTYDTYILEIEGLTVATDEEDISVQFGTGGTPTYQTSNYNYSKAGLGATAATVSSETHDAASDNVTSRIILGRKTGNAGAIGNAAGESFSGTITIHKPSSTSIYKHITWQCVYSDTLARITTYTGGGVYKSTTAVTSVRLLTGSGGNMTGSATLYGVTK